MQVGLVLVVGSLPGALSPEHGSVTVTQKPLVT